MSRNIVKSNHRLQDLIGELRKVSLESNVNLWGRIASDLEKKNLQDQEELLIYLNLVNQQKMEKLL